MLISIDVAAQAISDLRAKLSLSFFPNDLLANDDQSITKRDFSSVILVPSNGYTFQRSSTQASLGVDLSVVTGGWAWGDALFCHDD